MPRITCFHDRLSHLSRSQLSADVMSVLKGNQSRPMSFLVRLRTATRLGPLRTEEDAAHAKELVAAATKIFADAAEQLLKRDPTVRWFPRPSAVFPAVVVNAKPSSRGLLRALPGVVSVKLLGAARPLPVAKSEPTKAAVQHRAAASDSAAAKHKWIPKPKRAQRRQAGSKRVDA